MEFQLIKLGLKSFKRVNRGTAVLSTVHAAPIPATERRRATPRVVHPGDPRCPSAALIIARVLEASSSPFPFLASRADRANPSSSHRPSFVIPPAKPHHPASINRARRCATSPRTPSAPPRTSSSCFPGRIGLAPSSRPRPPLPISVEWAPSSP